MERLGLFSHWRFLFTLPLMVMIVSCSPQQEERTTIKIQLPQTAGVQTANLKSALQKSGKVGAFNNNSWGAANPTNFDQISCFGILVGGPSDNLKEIQCSKQSGELAFAAGIVQWGYAAGGVIELEVPVGSAREFALVGFAANTSGSCDLSSGQLQFANLSAPHIIGRKTQDITPGSAQVDITVQSDLSDAVEFDKCNLPVFGIDPANPGTNPTTLVISDGPTYDFGDVLNSTAVTKVLTLTNFADFEALNLSETGIAAPFYYVGGSYPGTGGSCGSSLAQGESCEIAIEFMPPSIAGFSGNVNVSYENAEGDSFSSSIDLIGQGVGSASLAFTLGTYDYGTIANGATVSATLTIQNTGGLEATGLSDSGPSINAPFAYDGGSFPGTGGSCLSTLAAGQSCTVVVNFSPIGGPHGDSLIVDYNDGVSAQTASIPLSGIGAAPASLAIDTTPSGDPFDYGNVIVGGGVNKLFTISNAGGVDATGLAEISLSGNYSINGAFPGSGGNCTTTLSSGANCDIGVIYMPAASGFTASTITIQYNDGVGLQSATHGVQGTGDNPALLTIDQGPTYDYGTQVTGSVTNNTFTISNSGDVMATGMSGSGLAAPYQFNGGGYPGTGGTCGGTLAAGASCDISVTYMPTVSSPADNDTIVIDYTDGLAAQQATRDITGNAQSPAVLTISGGPTVDFSNVVIGDISVIQLTITNSGEAQATGLSEISLAAPYDYDGGGGFPGTGAGACAATLNGGNSTCNIYVRFSPAGPGVANDTITVDYNDGLAAQQATRNVTGNGQTPASLVITSPGVDPHDFGFVTLTSPATQLFTLQNVGDATATGIAEVMLGLPYSINGAWPGAGGDCGVTLAGSGASCDFEVLFQPTVTGNFADTIDINYNDGLGIQSLTFDVTGDGENPAVLVVNNHTEPYDYGNVTSGSNYAEIFTIENTGDSTATGIGDGGGLALPYQYTGGSFPGLGGNCLTSLVSTASCDIEVEFVPTANAIANDTIEVSYNDGAGLQSLSFDVVGEGVAPASVVISDTDPYDFGTVDVGSNTGHIFTISNIGDSYATSVAFSGLAAAAYNYIFDECSGAIDPGGSCGVYVEFAPTGTGVVPDVIDVDYNDGVGAAATVSRTVTGTGDTSGTLASLTIAPATSHNFGSQGLGTYADNVFTITNAVANNATSLSVSLAIGDDFEIRGTNCGATLGAGSCTVKVRFTPHIDSMVGDSLIIQYDNGTNVIETSVSLQGSGFLSTVSGWSVAATANQPAPRSKFTMTEGAGHYFVWGGDLGASVTNTGHIYEHVNDIWTTMTTTGAPVARRGHTAIWTGKELLVWGGENHAGSIRYQSGARYNPVADSWNAMTEVGLVSQQRTDHTALWTGSEMLIFGGHNGGPHPSTNWRYHAGNDTWTQMNPTGRLSDRAHAAGVWTGKHAIFWGGVVNGTPQGDGKLYSPGADAWSTMAAGPSARRDFAYTWTGSHFIVFGGYDGSVRLNDMWSYDPIANNWDQLSYSDDIGAPEPRNFAQAVWTGSHILVWGGLGNAGKLDSGGLFSPQTGTWEVTDLSGAPAARSHFQMAHNRSKVFIFGGLDSSNIELAGGVLIQGASSYPKIKDISASMNHVCALYDNGNVKCWGSDAFAALGQGTSGINIGGSVGEMAALTPVTLPAGRSAIQIETGEDFSCALLDDFSVACWGKGANYRMGNNDNVSNISVPAATGLQGVYKITLGGRHGCALKEDGRVVCWGSNDVGQVGDNTTGTDRGLPVYVRNPGDTGDLDSIVDIDAGFAHTCAIDDRGRVLCWGRGDNGQMGNGASVMANALPILSGFSSYPAGQVRSGGDTTCVTHFGELYCWGDDTFGQAGLSIAGAATSPGQVPGLAELNEVAVSVGQEHSCAFNANSLFCWGRNFNGQLGINSSTNQATPAGVLAHEQDVKKIATGAAFTCALYHDSDIKCWGRNTEGQLGRDDTMTNVGGATNQVDTVKDIDF